MLLEGSSKRSGIQEPCMAVTSSQLLQRTWRARSLSGQGPGAGAIGWDMDGQDPADSLWVCVPPLLPPTEHTLGEGPA